MKDWTIVIQIAVVFVGVGLSYLVGRQHGRSEERQFWLMRAEALGTAVSITGLITNGLVHAEAVLSVLASWYADVGYVPEPQEVTRDG